MCGGDDGLTIIIFGLVVAIFGLLFVILND